MDTKQAVRAVRIVRCAFRVWAFAIAIMSADRACGQPLEIDYDASRVEIRGEAFGFIPAELWFSEFEAEVTLAESMTELKSAAFRFSYEALTSGRENRDNKIRNWLEAERFPEGRFDVERLEEREGKTFAIGQLRLHGVSRQAEFVYSIDSDSEEVRLSARASIDYREWGLPTLRVLIFSVSPELKINIDVRGRIEADAG